MLQPYGQAYKIRGYPGCQLLFRGQLLMRSSCRVYRQALGIAYIGKMRYQFKGIDESPACFNTSLNPKTDDCAGPPGKVLLRPLFLRAVIQPG